MKRRAKSNKRTVVGTAPINTYFGAVSPEITEEHSKESSSDEE
jgi:hypothetical protein